jgi:rare lipoprotein A
MKYLLCSVVLFGMCGVAATTAHRRPTHFRPFKATAYSDHGVTASGAHTRVGSVAADPRVLPLGTKIRVTNAGPYSGVYVVTDTGSQVKGHHIDLFVPLRAAAREFGKKLVLVSVLEWGPRPAAPIT